MAKVNVKLELLADVSAEAAWEALCKELGVYKYFQKGESYEWEYDYKRNALVCTEYSSMGISEETEVVYDRSVVNRYYLMKELKDELLEKD